MSFTRNRLRRLEALDAGGPCPGCEPRPNGPSHIVYYEGEERPKEAAERCPRCDRHLRFLIRVVYEDGGGAIPNG